MNRIKKILMKRDGLTAAEAEIAIENARDAFYEYLAVGDTESANNICEECFGLEADYIFEIL